MIVKDRISVGRSWRVRLLLTEDEVDRVDNAVFSSGSLSRALLVLEAVQVGLRMLNFRAAPGRRCRRIDVRIPAELRKRINEVAKRLDLSQQSLLRHFLFQYLALAPWQDKPNNEKQTSRAADNSTEPSETKPTKVELLTVKDMPEYERVTQQLTEVLKKLGGYEPTVDGIYVDQIARAAIYAKRIEVFLDSDSATEHTYSKVTDSKIKLSKTIESAMHQLALSRRDRIGNQTEGGLKKELLEALERGLETAEQ